MSQLSFAPLLWFVAIIVMIPVALWLLKRTPIGATSAAGVMRHIATLPISQNQRLVTVEVGQGDDARWLVLGVTNAGISTLHTLPPQPQATTGSGGQRPFGQAPAFAQVLDRLRRPSGPQR
jgi:flagellar protein FliO/FliZ